MNEVLYFENFNLTDLKTPVKVEVLEQLLIQSKYDLEEIKFLTRGFKQGFEIGYKGEPKCPNEGTKS